MIEYPLNDSNLLFLNSKISMLSWPVNPSILLIWLFLSYNFFNLGTLIYPILVILLLSKFNSSKNSNVCGTLKQSKLVI